MISFIGGGNENNQFFEFSVGVLITDSSTNAVTFRTSKNIVMKSMSSYKTVAMTIDS
jgi:hypothetical protein